MSNTHPLYLPITYQDAADHGRIILRDGSSALIRLSIRKDYKAIREFYQRLSPESRKMRFFSEAKPGEDVIESMCDSSNPNRCMTLLVWRHIEGANRIVATGSYIAENETTAEFAVAVDDTLQGKGLGGTILERLSVLAVSHGFTRFNAYTHMNNRLMLDVFRHSGFELQEQAEDGMFEVAFSVLPDKKSVSHALQRDRLFTKASIRPFFHPSSVAVISSSQEEHSTGMLILEQLLNSKFSGDVYAVNPNVDILAGVHTLKSAEELPDGIDLVVIAVPAKKVESIIDACANRDARALIITTAGYAESGADGRKRQEKLLEKVRGYGMRLLGPNSLGIINTDPAVNLNASLSDTFPSRGRVAVSSQSGALGMTLLQIAKQRNIGLSMFISMGNKADVTGNDLLYYWEDDSSTDVILLYLESFGNPRRFGRIAREVSLRKPIVCVKSGSYRSTKEEHAVEALFEHTGVIRVRTIEEMFDTAALLGNQPLPSGRRVSIITNSRGAGVLCADACVSSGLEIAYLSTREKKGLQSKLPDGSSLEGIIDLTSSATPEHYGKAILAALSSRDSDSIILLYTPVVSRPVTPILDELSKALSKKRETQDTFKPIITVMMADSSAGSVIHHRGASFPCYQFPEKAAHTLSAANRYREWRNAPAGVVPYYEDVELKQIRHLLESFECRDDQGWLNKDAINTVLDLTGVAVDHTDDPDSAAVTIEIAQHSLFGPVLSFGETSWLYRTIPLTDEDARILSEHSPIPTHAQPALTEIILRLSFLAEELPEVEELSVSISNKCEIQTLKSKIKQCV